jgi:hypothetical protein
LCLYAAPPKKGSWKKRKDGKDWLKLGEYQCAYCKKEQKKLKNKWPSEGLRTSRARDSDDEWQGLRL